jgi:hypothetical protein
VKDIPCNSPVTPLKLPGKSPISGHGLVRFVMDERDVRAGVLPAY